MAFDTDRFATALLFLGVGLIACLMPAQTDTWWLLRAGEEMWRSGRIMLHDEFTHTVAGQYWPNHEWLSQVIFYGLYRVGGLPLLTAFCAAAVLVAWFLVFRITPGTVELRLLLIGTGAALTTPGWSLRPQTITLTFFAATLWILVRNRFVWSLPGLFLLWANLHGAVAAGGLLIIAATIASALVRRERLARLVLVGAFCFLATTATPLWWSYWFEIPSSLARLQAYGVLEWRAPSLSNPADLPFWFIVVAFSVLAMVRHRALRSWNAVVLMISTALMLILALRSTRNFALFALCVAPATGSLLAYDARVFAAPKRKDHNSLVRPALLALSIVASASFVVFAWSLPLQRLDWEPISEEMKAAISQCDGPLYNRYDDGGEIIWFLRNRKVFMDSRQDPFPEQMVFDQIRLERTGEYAQTFQRYSIACALTPEGSPLARRLKRDGWNEIPAGPGWRVFTSNSRVH